jgi:hypothetical protein
LERAYHKGVFAGNLSEKELIREVAAETEKMRSQILKT